MRIAAIFDLYDLSGGNKFVKSEIVINYFNHGGCVPCDEEWIAIWYWDLKTMRNSQIEENCDKKQLF